MALSLLTVGVSTAMGVGVGVSVEAGVGVEVQAVIKPKVSKIIETMLVRGFGVTANSLSLFFFLTENQAQPLPERADPGMAGRIDRPGGGGMRAVSCLFI